MLWIAGDSRGDAIVKSNLDGSNSVKIVFEAASKQFFRSLTVDQHNNRVYWLTHVNKELESATLEGRDRRKIYDFFNPITRIDILGDNLYFEIPIDKSIWVIAIIIITGISEFILINHSFFKLENK